MFIAVFLGVWSLLHAYVGWRLCGVPWLAARLGARPLALAFILLALVYPVARILAARGIQSIAQPLEYFGALWVGVLFLLFAAVLATDVVTLGGWLWPRFAPVLRGWTSLAALALASIAIVQGLCPPVVREHEVALPGLPAERDGLTIVVLSDLHLGALIGEHWLAARLKQVDALRPDAIVIAGDLVDFDLDGALSLQTTLRRLRAPLGVWAVLGNHDAYAGADRVVAFAEGAGVRVLRNRSAEIGPGLRLAGIDDPAQIHFSDTPSDTARNLAAALAGPRDGATILISHTPDSRLAASAAAAGADLMLSGHTHGGQIWPFGHLVHLRFPLFAGRYEISGMTVLVSRGAGTWGPRMRLWHRGEILRVRLRSTAATAGAVRAT
jgi:predicted MPP superfamily phosphohydrolase